MKKYIYTLLLTTTLIFNPLTASAEFELDCYGRPIITKAFMQEAYSEIAEAIIKSTIAERAKVLQYFKSFYVEATTDAGFDTETIPFRAPDLSPNGHNLLEGLMMSLSILDAKPTFSSPCVIWEYGRIMNLVDVSDSLYAELEASLRRKYSPATVDTWKQYLKSIQDTILLLIESKK